MSVIAIYQYINKIAACYDAGDDIIVPPPLQRRVSIADRTAANRGTVFMLYLLIAVYRVNQEMGEVIPQRESVIEGLRQLTEALTDRSRLDELYKQANGNSEFEALFEVLGMDSLNLSEKLLVTSSLNSSAL